MTVCGIVPIEIDPASCSSKNGDTKEEMLSDGSLVEWIGRTSAKKDLANMLPSYIESCLCASLAAKH